MGYQFLALSCLLAGLSGITVVFPSTCPKACRCFLDPTSSLETVECSGKRITAIPLGIPGTTQALYIHGGNISTLLNASFQNLNILIKLHLVSCEIQKIQTGAFSNLKTVTELYLNQNELELSNNIYISGIFSGLGNLQILALNRNSDVRSPNMEYPDRVWKDVPLLRDLRIDGLYHRTFPSGFSHLHYLTHLTVSGNFGNCYIDHLQNGTFAAFANSSLRYLDISSCNIYSVDPFVFSPLRKLDTILVGNQNCQMPCIQNFLTGLNETSITYVDMTAVCGPGSHILTKDKIWPIKYTLLKTLLLDHNYITWAEYGAVDALPSSLEILTIKKNYIIGDYSALSRFMFLPRLKKIEVSFLIALWNFSPIPIPLPLNLESITISGMHTDTIIPIMHFDAHNKLRSLIWLDSTIHTFFGYIKGLDHLENFTLANVNCKNISRGYFQFFKELKMVNLSKNFLGDIISEEKTGVYFAGLMELEVFDISENVVRSLSKHFLTNMAALTHVYLQKNALMNFDLEIGHMTELQHIDLSTNSISSLADAVIGEMTSLMNKNNLTINLKNNPIKCACDTLYVLRWLKENREHFVAYDTYTCSSFNATSLATSDVDSVVDYLQYACASYDGVIYATSVIIAVFFGIILFGMFYRYHMHLKYWFHVVRRNMQTTVLRQSNKYKYDAFISYDESEEDFVINTLLPKYENERHLKLCIHCRDFMPGTPITDNIVGAIQCSRKSVFILSREFLKSGWCRYEFNMARMEHIYSGRPTIIVVMYEQVGKLPLEILEALDAETYLSMECSRPAAFWDRLARAIRGEQI